MATQTTPKPDLSLQDLYEELGKTIAIMPQEDDVQKLRMKQLAERNTMVDRHKAELDALLAKIKKADDKCSDLIKVVRKVIAGENPLVAYMATRGTSE